MKINREKLVRRHNPTLNKIDFESPLSVGNGEFAFTADVTGMQTLYSDYAKHLLPLCTMSQWGWHSTPASETRKEYTQEDLEQTEYDFSGRPVSYPVHPKKGNEEVYHWLRQNPHRIHLGTIGLAWKAQELHANQISEIHQELDLYSGILSSQFAIEGNDCAIKTAVHSKEDAVAFSIASESLTDELSVVLRLPYGSHEKSGADWSKIDAHNTFIPTITDTSITVSRIMDDTKYYLTIVSEQIMEPIKLDRHEIFLKTKENKFDFTVHFGFESVAVTDDVFADSRAAWENFWNSGAAVSFLGSTHPKAMELERRVILSQYLLAIQSAGTLPPAETGLTCNSWYGKFHLEMHPWHAMWMAMWNKGSLLERSLPWYHQHLTDAKNNAQRNGYLGARWPKMVASEAVDAPSPIATLLIWQQPHILWMLEMLYAGNQSQEFLERHWELVEETAIFMADFAVKNEETGCYELLAPLIPVQERFDPKTTNNPAFEVEYWRLGLSISALWAERLGKEVPALWSEVASNMAPLAQKDGMYLAHRDCPETFLQYTEDHPSMLGVMGMIPTQTADAVVVEKTLHKVLEIWDYDSLWGWDFAFMAMTATMLGKSKLATEILLKETKKNEYVASGNNLQRTRNDLPLYLPGNGSLLWAVALMCTGYEGETKKNPGFSAEEGWQVTWEDLVTPPAIGGK